MKKSKNLSVFLAAILLLIGCEKEKPPVDKEYTPDHWPVVKTLGATPLTSSTATLTGTVRTYGLSTTVTFEYGTTTSYGNTVTAHQSPITEDGTTNISADISGLIPDTTYHFRVKAENSLWKNFYGRDVEFTIHSPEVETLDVTNITGTSATLNGTVNTYGLSTIVTFEYGTTTSYGHTVTAHQSPATGNIITNVSADISGLTPCTIYHFRVKAENFLGKDFYGRDMEFPVHSPEVETLEVTNVTGTSTKLNGTVNVYGLSTTVTFEYGTTPGYGSTVTANQSPVTGKSIININADISGLTTCTIYHYRVKAENPCGIVYGSDKTFICQGNSFFWTTYTTANGLADNSVYAIAIDAQGNKWFGTERGVSKFDGTNYWTNYTSLGGLNSIKAIAIDAQNNKWFGTSGGGVLKFDGTTWTTFTTADGLADNNVNAIKIDAQGNLWFGTQGGVTQFDGTNYWTNYSSGLISITAIAIDAQNNKWFGTSGGGVLKFDGTTWTTYTQENSGLVSNMVNAIAIDAQGNKWFGTGYWELTEGGVSKFDGTNWTTYNTANSSLPYNYVTSIAIDSQGNKWFGTHLDEWDSDGGISKFDGTTWTTYTTADGLVGNFVTSIAIDGSNNIWMACIQAGFSYFMEGPYYDGAGVSKLSQCAME